MPPRKRTPAKTTKAKAKAKEETEPTPIFDEAEAKLKNSGPHHDDTDVPAALKRETQDGKGEEDPGPSDWNGYATEGVEQEEAK